MEIVFYPQPANGNTVYFYFRLDAAATIRIDIFNVAGEKTIELEEESVLPGNRRTPWDIRGVAPGIYLYRLRVRSAGQETVSDWKKDVMVKK
jgi:hypothetical protein